MHLYLQINNNVWDFTYHEHYSYFTIKSLVRFFENMEMELIDVTPNLTKGGSMRCVVQLKGGNRKAYKSVQEHIQLENKAGFHTKVVFDKYSAGS